MLAPTVAPTTAPTLAPESDDITPPAGVTPSIRSQMWDLGASAGLLFPGRIDLRDPNGKVDTNTSPIFRVILDSYLIQRLSAGLSLTFIPVALRNDLNLGSWGGDSYRLPKSGIFVFDFCGTLKPRFFIGERVAIKPGLGVGYRRAFSGEKAARIAGFALDGSVEVQYLAEGDWKLYLDGGLLTQPYGEVTDVAYVSFGPILYLTAGVGIGGS